MGQEKVINNAFFKNTFVWNHKAHILYLVYNMI